MHNPITIERLRDYIAHAHEITAECPACRHRALLDVLALAVAHGEENKLAQIGRRLRCVNCGRKGTPLWTISPASVRRVT